MVSSSIPAGLGAQYALKVLNGAASAPGGAFSLPAGSAGQGLPGLAGGGAFSAVKSGLASAAGTTSAAPGLITAIRRQFDPPSGSGWAASAAAGRSYAHASGFMDARTRSAGSGSVV